MISTASSPRIATLDILRGIAVMGILAMNAPGFAFPEAAYFNPMAYGGSTGADLIGWIGGFIFFDGKMRGLFSLLFGASMLLIVEKAQAKDENPAVAHYRRILWLLVFGAAHFYLIWWGDILLHYALIALVAFPLCYLGTRALGIWIAVLILIDLLTMTTSASEFLRMSADAAQPGADLAIVQQWEAMSRGFAPLDPDLLRQSLELHTGPYLELLRHRWATEASAPLDFLFFGAPETLALMLLGMVGLRNGFLTGGWSDARYRRVAFWCLAPGIAGFAVLAWIIIRSGFDPAMVFAGSFGGTVIFRFLMVIGYAALIIVLTRRGGALAARIAAAGRMAFTNYLGTSIVMTGLFYGWGLGLFGALGRAELWLLVFAVWGLILLWSKPWLDRHLYGPLEWLWRTLARWEMQPMRRAAPPR